MSASLVGSEMCIRDSRDARRAVTHGGNRFRNERRARTARGRRGHHLAEAGVRRRGLSAGP
eukprot:7282170-Alexandrium_andersonii.AAC.1